MEKELTKFEKLSVENAIKKTENIWVEKIQLRGGIFNTVEIGYVEFELHRRYPLWNFEIMEDKQIDGQIVVKGKLTVNSLDGKMSIIKMQYGSAEVKKTKDGKIMDLANDYKSAASDCLKKTASLLGIAFDVYHPKVYEKLKKLYAVKDVKPKDVKPVEQLLCLLCGKKITAQEATYSKAEFGETYCRNCQKTIIKK